MPNERIATTGELATAVNDPYTADDERQTIVYELRAALREMPPMANATNIEVGK